MSSAGGHASLRVRALEICSVVHGPPSRRTLTPSPLASFSSIESVGSCFPVSSRARRLRPIPTSRRVVPRGQSAPLSDRLELCRHTFLGSHLVPHLGTTRVGCPESCRDDPTSFPISRSPPQSRQCAHEHGSATVCSRLTASAPSWNWQTTRATRLMPAQDRLTEVLSLTRPRMASRLPPAQARQSNIALIEPPPLCRRKREARLQTMFYVQRPHCLQFPSVAGQRNILVVV
jgi:hypothetical protein